MHRRLLALPAFALAFALPAPVALASEGGAPAPSGSGGTEVGTPVDPAVVPRTPRRGWPKRPVAKVFRVSPSVVAGAPVDFTYRINARAKRVRARIAILPAGGGRPVAKIDLGRQLTRRAMNYRWMPPAGAGPPAGSYVARLHAVDPSGRTLARRSSASGRATLTVTAPPAAAVATVPGVFPVAGPHSFGEEGARFGAPRDDHTHEGQDVMAAEGTPVVAPVAGTITRRAYQSDGAGHYVVLDGDDGRDYFLCHFVPSSTVVSEGQRVASGQQLAAVGHSGASSGPHLHFEIWVVGWRVEGGYPIDPLPDLMRWEAGPG